MTRYQLAKLICMAGGMEARKRVQKTVHLLQEAGCKFDAKFRLHYFGPYSSDVAGLLDELVKADVLKESVESVGGGSKYSYVFDEKFTPSLQKCEEMPSTKEAVSAVLCTPRSAAGTRTERRTKSQKTARQNHDGSSRPYCSRGG